MTALTIGRDRAAFWALSLGTIHVLSLMLYPAFICGCHFHAKALPVAAIPILAGVYPFVAFRTRRERCVGYIGICASAAWVVYVWNSNIIFAFIQ